MPILNPKKNESLSGSTTRSTSDGNGTQEITTNFLPTRVVFSAVADNDSGVWSKGEDDGDAANCIKGNITLITLVSVVNNSNTNSIHVENVSGNGYTGKITELTETGFTITWVKVGNGLNLTLNYIAVS